MMASSKKKRKKTWVYVVALAALLTGGILFVLNYTSFFSEHLTTKSDCKFNPEISEKNKDLIRETIITVANEGVFSLMGKEKHLKQIGAIVSNEVSDFAYWGYVFTSPDLARGMKTIQKSSLKYKGYIKGTQKQNLREYHENPCYLEQAKGLARYLNLPEEEFIALLKECLDNSSKNKLEFKKYIDYMIKKKSP